MAKVIRTDESIDIYVSASNENLNRLIVRAQRSGEGAVEHVKDFYLEHISFHAMLVNLAAEQSADQAGDGDSDTAPEQEEARELKRVSETVTGLMLNVFEAITV